jgi:hypothetical protein
LIGIGFRERDYAFDFKSVLNDYCRYIDRMDMAANGGKSSVVRTAYCCLARTIFMTDCFDLQAADVDEDLEDLDINAPTSSQSPSDAAPKRDLAIKAGEKIKVPTKGFLHKQPKDPSNTLISPEASKPSSIGKIKAPPSGVLASLSSLKALTSEQTSSSAAGISSGSESVTSISSGNNSAPPSEGEDWGDFETA